jgi:hypothetical protein
LQSLSWYRNRLARMSAGEIVQRTCRVLRDRAESAGLLTAAVVLLPVRVAAVNSWLKLDALSTPGQTEAAADDILAGRERVFATSHVHASGELHWNRDPASGRETPPSFGKLIDYRDESLVGNIKYVWEPNRHLELVTLALAFRKTRGTQYLQGIRLRVESWLDQCPYLCGVNWLSSLELGIRLINWSLTWQLIGHADSVLFTGNDGDQLRRRWLRSIYQHVHFIHHYYSKYSSANNHLIGEAAGVYVASSTWPYWPEFGKWGATAQQLLISEAQRQTFDDGVNKEQAVAYQQFVLDFFVLSALARRPNGDTFPLEYWRSIERMIEFLASIMDVDGNVPMFGDADDGFVVRLSYEPGFCPYRSLLATGAMLFGRPDFAAKSRILDDKSRLLVGEDGWDLLSRRGRQKRARGRSFPDGGYYILGTALDTRQEVRVVADAGPLGYLSIAAHGHADALAVVLSIGGREILVDPGTFTYHTMPLWRGYFRGTGAHNTVRLDGLDQSVQAGNFMWQQHARATCLKFAPAEGGGRFAAEHDGYRRLHDPVTHRREIEMRSGQIEIVDVLTCRQAHRVERCWHFSEHCKVDVEDGILTIRNGPVRVTMQSAGPDPEVRKYRGSVDPPAGWVSRSFDVKVPADTVYMLNSIEGTTALMTLISWKIEHGADTDED